VIDIVFLAHHYRTRIERGERGRKEEEEREGRKGGEEREREGRGRKGGRAGKGETDRQAQSAALSNFYFMCASCYSAEKNARSAGRW